MKAHSTNIVTLFQKMRPALLFIVLLMIALLLFKQIALPDRRTILTRDGKHFYATTIAKNTYHIPAGYFRYSVMPPETVDKDILMDAALPDLHEITPGSPESTEVTKRSWGTVVGLLITDASTTTSHDFRWGNKTKNYGPLTYAGESFGLRKYISAKGSAGTLIRDIVVYMNKELIPKPTDEQKKRALEEIYTDASSGTPRVYIACSGDIAFPNPYCSQHFVKDGLLFKISYGKEHLKEWQSIHSAAIAMMSSFRSNPSKEK